jgi:outer membrane protein OmpA-like peptidoglycan-associated protein
MRKVTSIILLFILIASAPGYTQTGVFVNDANIQDPRLMLVNPAVMAFHDRALFVSGYKMHYVSLGNEHLGNFYWGLSYPYFKAGTVGVTGQLFRSAMLLQPQIDLNYAISLWNERFALGGRAGLLGVSYNSEKFNLIDANDPLLRDGTSKYNFNLGVGILANPFADLYLGFSANHLNHPDLSLDDAKNRAAINANVSAIYLHPIFRPQISLEREENETYLNFGLESWLMANRAILRSSFSAERLSLGAAYQLGNWRLDYEYDYPLSDLNEVSDGSHQLTLSFRFGAPIPRFKLAIRPLDPVQTIQNGILPGDSASYQIIVQRLNQFSSPVILSTKDLPEKLTGRFSPSQLSATDSSRLVITADQNCPLDLFTVKVKARAGSRKKSVKTKLRIVQPEVIPPKIHISIKSKHDSITITVIRKISEESPLLNYIFFDKDEDQIPVNRYQLLDPAKDPLPPLEYFTKLPSISEQYRNILNLFGRRLQDDSTLRIMLVGYNAGVGSEKDSLELSRRRAESVKNYLVNVWKISENRIKVEPRHLPETPSPLEDPRGQEENRRVEILPAVGSEEILAPFTSTTLESEFSPPTCVFLTGGTIAEAGVRSWELLVEGPDGRTLRTWTGEANLLDSVMWDWRDDAGNPISFQDSLVYNLSLTDAYGQTRKASGASIRMRNEEREIETRVARSRLIFFAFDKYQLDLGSSRLHGELEKIVTKFRQRSGTKIEIRGHTDIIGDPIHNDSLAVRRAQAVKDELIRRGIPGDRISVEGFGSRNPLMTNDLPESRMMNRRVEVDVIYSNPDALEPKRQND